MKHDFETVVSRRNCGSIKWEQMLKNNPNAAADVAPLSVADMELKNPPEIIEGLKITSTRTFSAPPRQRKRITTPCAAG